MLAGTAKPRARDEWASSVPLSSAMMRPMSLLVGLLHILHARSTHASTSGSGSFSSQAGYARMSHLAHLLPLVRAAQMAPRKHLQPRLVVALQDRCHSSCCWPSRNTQEQSQALSVDPLLSAWRPLMEAGAG